MSNQIRVRKTTFTDGLFNDKITGYVPVNYVPHYMPHYANTFAVFTTAEGIQEDFNSINREFGCNTPAFVDVDGVQLPNYGFKNDGMEDEITMLSYITFVNSNGFLPEPKFTVGDVLPQGFDAVMDEFNNLSQPVEFEVVDDVTNEVIEGLYIFFGHICVAKE